MTWSTRLRPVFGVSKRSSTSTRRLVGVDRRWTVGVTTLTDIYGVGPVVGGLLIGYTADVSRFPTRHHYATYNGTAPIDASSGSRKRHRLNPRGNRMLNHALHLIAITQLRYPDTAGRVFYERKLAEGKTKKEAIRALKRRLSDVVYRHLVADQQNS